MKIPDNIPAYMLRFRAVNDISQAEMAALCKVTTQTIYNIESGKKDTASRLTLAKIKAVIGLPIE